LEAVIILPNQLYKEHPLLDDSKQIYLVEEDTYFTKYNFHKKKLILHRASMKAYTTQQREYKIKYIENKPNKTLETLFEDLVDKKISKVQLTEVLDHQLEDNLAKLSEKHKINLKITGNPSFLTPKEWIQEYFQNSNYRMTSFYIAQRKRLKILLESGKPIGGKMEL